MIAGPTEKKKERESMGKERKKKNGERMDIDRQR